jgi:hypothetical protein
LAACRPASRKGGCWAAGRQFALKNCAKFSIYIYFFVLSGRLFAHRANCLKTRGNLRIAQLARCLEGVLFFAVPSISTPQGDAYVNASFHL